MFRFLRSILFFLLAAAVVAPLAACAEVPGDDIPDDVGIVLGAHSGAPRVTPDELASPLDLLDRPGDRLIVVVPDGAPFVAVDVTVPDLSGNSQRRAEELDALRARVVEAILAIQARTPEVDLTEGISLAARAFREGARHHLVLLDPGLQTVGALSMLGGRLFAEPATFVEAAAQNATLPNLADVAVRMPRPTVVVDPQPTLTQEAALAVTSVWAAYFARTGATDVDLTATDLLPSGATDAALPAVTPVPVERPTAVAAADCRRPLADSSIGFAAGSAELSDPTRARALVAETVAALSGCGGDWFVDGSASAEGSGNDELSTMRAESIRGLVADAAGVASEAIETRGWGANWPCRTPDIDAQGRLILDAALSNRSVVIRRGDLTC